MKNDLEKILDNFVPHGVQEKVDLEFFYKSLKNNKSLTRDSLAHFTASAFVLNKNHDKALMIFHKIFNSWGWLGGHADGNSDLLEVAKKEVREESGLVSISEISGSPISIEVIPVFSHIHRTHGYVPAHLHLNATFLFEADEHECLVKNIEETDGIAWVPITDFIDKVTEVGMKDIYKKIISRVKK